MAGYPRTVLEFHDWFPDDQACRDYLAGLRWPEGFRCPVCEGPDHWITGRGLRHCRGCGRQTSVTAGTLFADTHLSLRLWFEASGHVISQKNGVSALGLQRVLGLGSYRTAWNVLHKLRRAMVRPGRDRLQGHFKGEAETLRYQERRWYPRVEKELFGDAARALE